MVTRRILLVSLMTLLAAIMVSSAMALQPTSLPQNPHSFSTISPQMMQTNEQIKKMYANGMSKSQIQDWFRQRQSAKPIVGLANPNLDGTFGNRMNKSTKSANHVNNANENADKLSAGFVPHGIPISKTKSNGQNKFSTKALLDIEASVAIDGLSLELVDGYGTPEQRIVTRFSNTQNTVISASTLINPGGFNRATSTTGANADVCDVPPCVVAYNSTEGLVYSYAGLVWEDVVRTQLISNNTVRNVTGDFVVATASTGIWPGSNDLTGVLAGQYGCPPGDESFNDGDIVYQGVCAAYRAAYDLPNTLGFCLSPTHGGNIMIGGTDSTLYEGELDCVNAATYFNVTVPTNFDDSVVYDTISFGTTELSNITDFGEYLLLESGSAVTLLPDLALRTVYSIVANTLDPTLETTVNTTGLFAIFLDQVASATNAALNALPEFIFVIRINETYSTTWRMTSEQYIRQQYVWTSDGLGVQEYLYVLINNADEYSDGVTVLGKPFFDTRYVALQRDAGSDGQVCVAPQSALSCRIGCASFTSQSSCAANDACGWCYDLATQSSVCVSNAEFGTSTSDIGASTFYYQTVCYVDISKNTVTATSGAYDIVPPISAVLSTAGLIAMAAAALF